MSTTTTERCTVASMRRALTPGTRIHIENHYRPQATRDTVVQPGTNTVDLVTIGYRPDGTPVDSHLAWPKAAELSGGEGVFHVTNGGRPFLTITILESV